MGLFGKKENNNQESVQLTSSSDEQPSENEYKHAPPQQNEDLPMDLGTVQDIFSFSFLRGRPIVNFILAVLWSIGLPVLLYELLRPHIGQVLAMIAASCPPIAIVVVRMIREKTFDALGLVAGISFLITGIISIAQPDEKTSAICESIVPLLVGVSCLLSILPIRIGRFEMRPLIFQVAGQIMPRQEEDDKLDQYDQNRLATMEKPRSKRQKLDYLYRNMTRFRHDMRVMTATWGITLIAAFVVKVIVVMTQTDTSHAETVGYIVFCLATGAMMVFTWLYTKIVKKHVTENTQEGLHNASWGIQAVNNTYNQVLGY
ncbi:hypothetical protein BC940DRAFT_309693 [Gongronella butleri]|nr:hypothetical protein BC940DRAFT_309693 [Gongronella butleri]